MAAQGFDPGTHITFPAYSPQWLGFFLTVALSVITCCVSTIIPIYRSGKVPSLLVLKNILEGGDSRIVKISKLISIIFIVFILIIFLVKISSSSAEELNVEVLFNASLQSGILTVLAVHFSTTLILFPLLDFASRILFRLGRVKLGLSIRSVKHKLDINYFSLNCLFIGISGFCIISIVLSTSLEVLKTYGVSRINSVDTVLLTALVSVTCLAVSLAILVLNTSLIRREQGLLRVSGYTPAEVVHWHALNSLIYSGLATVLALLPMGVTSFVSSLIAQRIIGKVYIYFPIKEMLISFMICWLAVFATSFIFNFKHVKNGPW
ncbi:MAG: hypothetical protein Q4C74_07990 [Rothia sp. (in: high G+C Gram-positive bacteria)]|nr:hypothetical protein [Rothia sp. (in: high G+C Gram-positive bacteria)]